MTPTAELQEALVGAAEGADEVLVQGGEELQGGGGAAGEEGFARLAFQLEDDPVVAHRTGRSSLLAADEADLTEDAAGGKLGKELLAARTRTVTSTLPLATMKQLPPAHLRSPPQFLPAGPSGA
jgi:hypothetical protein